MKFINKINKYLVENFPLIWNTRLAWMTLTALILHLVFFIIGYNYVNTQTDISEQYRLDKFYFDTSIVFVGILISTIVLLVWILYYLKNNAFKNAYHLKKGTLFTQFCIIFFIFFANTTQYYSFNEGLKLKIKNLYDWKEIDNDIKEINKLSIFLLDTYADYKIKNKKYPHPFPLKHSTDKKEDLGDYIDTTQPYFEYHYGIFYQFYKLDTPKINIARNEGNKISESNNFKFRIVYDVSKYKDLLINESLLNYSKELYHYGQDSLDYSVMLKFYETLLNKKDENEIKKVILPFFSLAKKYNIEHNLNIKDWLTLINTEDNYHIKATILDEDPSNYDNHQIKKIKENYYRYITVKDTIELKNLHQKERKFISYKCNVKNNGSTAICERRKIEYFKDIPYCNLGRLNDFFHNVHEAYNHKYEDHSIIPFFSLSFVLALLLFLFKVTDIKTILLSFVFGSILVLIFILITENLSSILDKSGYISDDYYKTKKYVEMTILLFISIIIVIASTIAFKMRWKKIITAILFSLSIVAIPIILLSVFNLYDNYIRYEYNINDDNITIWFDNYGFGSVILIWLIIIALYTRVIRKWKALPE